MAPIYDGAEAHIWRRTDVQDGPSRAGLTTEGLVLEAWGEGYQVGSLVILMLIVVCNYRRHIMLHKLILLEMFLAIWHGTFIFLDDPTYGWYLSATALLLFVSYQLHNYVAYLKIRPFLPRWGRLTFLITLCAVQPYWVFEAWDNFEYFNRGLNWNIYTRPWEALFRDPWWIFTTCYLLYKIKSQYEFTFRGLLSTSPKLAIMILCMVLSVIFLLTDVVVTARHQSQDSGIDPYWRLALVFKAASDAIFLDDFKSVLDSIAAKRFSEFNVDGVSIHRNGVSGTSGNSLSTQRAVSPTDFGTAANALQRQKSHVRKASMEQHSGSRLSGSAPRVSNGFGEDTTFPSARPRATTDPLWAELGFGAGSTIPITPSEQHLEHVPSGNTLNEGNHGGAEHLPQRPTRAFSRNDDQFQPQQ